MINETLQIFLWITAILLIISGIDDLYLDLLYWFLRGRHKSRFPEFSEMHTKKEKPIAIILGAWNESGVIGRTLSYAVRNLKYKNYRIFVGVYPNDVKSIDAVKAISLKDSRVIACINPQNGPTTKADNLNSIYAGLCEYEKIYGEFEVLIVHDAEDFIHPNSMKLYNFLIGYKGYHGIQIPVIPIKSKHGKTLHRTYCDAFAEIHTKDMVVRQGMGTFMPFSGTGMGFHRKAIYFLEMQNEMLKNGKDSIKKSENKIFLDARGRKVKLHQEYFRNNEEIVPAQLYFNNTKYLDDPFKSLIRTNTVYKRSSQSVIKRYTMAFITFVAIGIGFLVYQGNTLDNGTYVGVGYGRGFLFQSLYAEENKNSEYTYLPASPQDKIYDSKDENADILFNPTDKLKIDTDYNVIYIPLVDGKLEIQESVWSSLDLADDRLNAILLQPALSDMTGYISEYQTPNKTLYKVIVGYFNNIEEAQKYTKKIRELLY